MATEKYIEIVKKFAEVLKKEGIRIDQIILYGSYARGTPRPDSDIDIAVISRDFGKDRTEEGMMLFRIAGEIDPLLEPVPISLKSWEEDTWLPLIHEIKSKGILLKVA